MKNLSLLLVLSLIATQILLPQHYHTSMALTLPAPILHLNRLSYMVVHANLIHLAINAYTLLVLVFLCNARPIHFLIATTIAALIPSALLSVTPMLGMSVLNYALTGLLIANSRSWLLLFAVNLLIVGAGSFFSGIAVMPHLWGLVAGFSISTIFTKPMFND